MTRRRLTRLELRMEDLQEYESVKKQCEKKKIGLENQDSIAVAFGRSDETNFTNLKINKETIHERIGYNPTPRNPT